MNFEVKVSSTIDEKFWNQQLVKSNDSSIYQVSRYGRVYEDVFESKPFYIVVESNGEVAGQLLAIIHTKYYWKDSNLISKSLGSKLNLNSVLRWEYGPIIHHSESKKEILDAILSALDKIARENDVTMIRGTTQPYFGLDATDVFQKQGYDHSEWATYVIDLPPESDHLYNKLNKETRYDIRKAEKNGLELEIIDKFQAFEDYSELALSSRLRAGEKRRENALFVRKFWENLYESGHLHVFTAKKDGELLGAIEALTFNKSILQYGIANSPKAHLLGGTFLTWNAINWSIRNGFATFDMGGANPNPLTEKEKAIDFYKSKWGGRKLIYGKYVKMLNPAKWKLAAALSNPGKISKKILRQSQ